ncbi:MAG: insulinase family protein [Sedimentisphaerales bacterium]|nr:insulinase family protein [Sedimentisphaerales bacterium]
MEFKHKQLDNGLNIIGEVNPGAKSAAVGFFVKTGARDETQNVNGVSHFLEHMLFKGTDKLDAFEVNQAFDRTGAQFNAFTSEENTVFYAAILPEYVIEITKLWAQLMRPSLRTEDFDIEKNVIKEEIAMYQDMPNFDCMERCKTLHFDSHPCGNSVLGSVESIDNLFADQMRSYFENRYAPNNITLACAGNFDWEQICIAAQESCGSWVHKDVTRELKDCAGSGKKERVENESVTREHLCLMSSGVSAQDPSRFAAMLLANIVGDDVGSRFFWELVDKAIAETASLQYGAMDGTGFFCSYILCGSQNLDKVLDIVQGIFQKLAADGVTENELTMAKNKVLSELVIKNELPMGRLIDLGFNWTYHNQYIKIEDEIKAIKDVTTEDIKSLIEQLKPGDFTQLILGPKK